MTSTDNTIELDKSKWYFHVRISLISQIILLILLIYYVPITPIRIGAFTVLFVNLTYWYLLFKKGEMQRIKEEMISN